MAMFASKTQSLIIGDNRRCKAARCIVALLCVFTLVYTKASIAADSEPTYFIFHGERKSLTLDLENIAVRTTSGSVKTSAALNIVPSYTAIMTGSNASSGVGLIEVYDFDDSVDSKLSNVSTRGFVGTDNDVLIGGFIAAGGNGSSKVVIRANCSHLQFERRRC